MERNSHQTTKSKSRKNNQTAVSLAVKTAEWVEDYRIRVGFTDGTEKVVDFGPYLATHSHPYIDPFKDLGQFRGFYIDNGKLVWGEDWDMIFPTWQLHRGKISS